MGVALEKDYHEALHSNIADLRNSSLSQAIRAPS